MFNKTIVIRFVPFIIFLIIFLVYLSTLAPSIYWGDGPELVSAAYTMGIAHPSGYPLYTLLGKLFTFIPIGTIAYRLNIMSAFFASLAVMLLYFVAFKITKSRLAALFSSLTLGFSYTLWTQATIAEVYTLNAFFLVALILILLKWAETMKQRYLYAFSFILGLGLTNHLTLILAFPAFIFFIIWNIKKCHINHKNLVSIRAILLMLAFFVIGLAIYIYLPLRALQDPFINWGNPHNLKLFLQHVSGAGYGNHFLSGDIFLNLAKAVICLLVQFPLILVFALSGIPVLYIRNRIIFIFISLIALFNIVFNVIYDITDIIVYYIPFYIVISLFIGIGMGHFLSLVKARFYLTKHFIYTIFIIAFIVLLFSNAFSFASITKDGNSIWRVDRSKFSMADNYANFMFAYAKSNSVITGDWDDVVFPLTYYQAVENKRRDLVVLYKGILPYAPWYAEQLKQRYPERKLAIGGKNLTVVFGAPSLLYYVIVNPSLVDTFNATFIREYEAQQITVAPDTKH